MDFSTSNSPTAFLPKAAWCWVIGGTHSCSVLGHGQDQEELIIAFCLIAFHFLGP